jgi:hypothetical protein
MLLKTPPVWKVLERFWADAPETNRRQSAQHRTIRGNNLIGFSFFVMIEFRVAAFDC